MNLTVLGQQVADKFNLQALRNIKHQKHGEKIKKKLLLEKKAYKDKWFNNFDSALKMLN